MFDPPRPVFKIKEFLKNEINYREPTTYSAKRTFSAMAAAKLLQLCPTLCNPIDGSPPGSSVPGILQARILEWVAISYSNAWKWKGKAKSLSHVQLFPTPWTVAYQGPSSMGFSRQEYWSGLPCPSPEPSLVLPKLSKQRLPRFSNHVQFVKREAGAFYSKLCGS